MATSPSAVRLGLAEITAAAIADLREATAGTALAEVRPLLFAVTPLLVSDYAPGAATLSLDWFEEIRDEARPRQRFTATPRLLVSDDDVKQAVAVATAPLRDLRRIEEETDAIVAQAMREVEKDLQKLVSDGFRDTVTGNSVDDPAAVGWRRYAKPGACKFCLMCAGRGAVYTEASARFAAHRSCGCVAGPAYDPAAPRASAIQYVASRRTRTPEQRAQVRDYLNENFPDAPG